MSSPARPDPRSFTADRRCIRLRQWEDEAVVFDARTGDTRLLTADAGHVLAALLEAPSTLPGLAGRLADRLSPAGESPEAHLEAILTALASHELVTAERS